MKRERPWRKTKSAAMPISAMIDVIFLMLIFFLLTYKPAFLEAYAAVKHPGPPNEPPPIYRPQPVTLDVAVLPGEYRLENRRMSLIRIRDWLLGRASLDPETTIKIKVSPEATEGELVAVLDMCHDLQLRNLHVLTLKE